MAHNKKILVTGACGLIGRELCNQLIAQGYTDITAVDNQWKYADYVPANVHFINSNTVDFVNNNICNYDVIYHMSAINGTAYFYSMPNELVENNVQSDIAVFKWAKTNPETKVIYASSSEVVADTEILPTPEMSSVFIKNIHNPRWSYRLSKILSENYLVNSGINYVIIRFFNTYSEHTAKGHVIRDLLDKMSQGRFEVQSPLETRSFCYVADSVSAVIQLSELANRDIVNVGSEEEIMVKQVASILAESQGYQDVEWHQLINRPGSTKRRRPDLSRLRAYIPDYNPEPFKSVINRIKKCLTTVK